MQNKTISSLNTFQQQYHLTFILNPCLIIKEVAGHSAAWIAHLHGVQGVVSSNLTDPTSLKIAQCRKTKTGLFWLTMCNFSKKDS